MTTITYREFRMWLDGLLSGNEDRSALPSRDQWGKILAMLDRVEEASGSVLPSTSGENFWRSPAFEITAGGKPHRIWADGRTEGFGDGVTVVNRIPHLLAAYVQKKGE